MSLRVLCVVSLFWVRGWWVLLVGIGAVVLPYFAVMVGNAVASGGRTAHLPPAPLELGDGRVAQPTSSQGPATIIVDAPEVDPGETSAATDESPS